MDCKFVLNITIKINSYNESKDNSTEIICLCENHDYYSQFFKNKKSLTLKEIRDIISLRHPMYQKKLWQQLKKIQNLISISTIIFILSFLAIIIFLFANIK